MVSFYLGLALRHTQSVLVDAKLFVGRVRGCERCNGKLVLSLFASLLQYIKSIISCKNLIVVFGFNKQGATVNSLLLNKG